MNGGSEARRAERRAVPQRDCHDGHLLQDHQERDDTGGGKRVSGSRRSWNAQTDLQPPWWSRSMRAVARRASSEQMNTMLTSTSAPAHAWRCQSAYGEMA